MKKSSATRFALTGTILLIIVFVSVRLIYLNVHQQTFAQITKKISCTEVRLQENGNTVRTITDASEIEEINNILSTYTYTEYKKFFKPAVRSLSQNQLTVVYDDGSVRFSFYADGYVLVNEKLRDIEGSRGQEIYQKLYAVCYPSAIAT